MRRVAIIASASGNGKTTVGRARAQRLGVQFVELDSLVHGPNWAGDERRGPARTAAVAVRRRTVAGGRPRLIHVRIVIALVAAAVFVGCGGDTTTERPPDAADINRANRAEEAIYLQRVLGDDPISESVSLRVNGTAAVRRGGGRGYWDIALELSRDEAERSLRLVRAAPFAALADNTITPGGFGGNDNERRYLMRRDGVSVTIAESDVPRTMRPLIKDLNAMIDGDLGHIVADDRHFSAVGVTGSDSSDDDQTSPTYENSPATPVDGGEGPQPALSLSCYGSGTRQSTGEGASGIKTGPIVLDGLTQKRRRRVLDARAVIEPGAAVTIAIAPQDRDRAGLLYGLDWRGPHRLAEAAKVVRLEGCSDTTTGGGAARFEGGIVRRGRGCVTLQLYTGGDTYTRRAGC